MKGPVRTPYDLGKDRHRKPNRQTRPKKTQLQKQRQSSREQSQAKKGHHDPNPPARFPGPSDFKKTNGSAIKPLVVEYTQPNTRSRGSSL